VAEVFVEDGVLEVAFIGDEQATSGLLRHLIQNNVPVLSFAEATSDLEEIFLTVTKGEVQ
jgi:ABC-2 type transport system ATP-binding protein